MAGYTIRLAVLLTLLTTMLSGLMVWLGQMNPRQDWVFYQKYEPTWDPAWSTAHMLDLDHHISALRPYVTSGWVHAFNIQHELASAFMLSLDRPGIVIYDIFDPADKKLIFMGSPTSRLNSIAWSPQGRYLSFVENDVDVTRLYVWDGEVVNLVHLVESRAEIPSMMWSYDNRLAFTLRSLRPQIDRMEIYLWDGRETINLTRTPDSEERIGTWSRDGQFAYISENTDGQKVMIWDGNNTTHAFTDLGIIRWFQWNSENDLTVSGSEMDTAPLQIYRWDGQNSVNLSLNTDTSHIYQIWSSNGRWAYAMFDPVTQDNISTIQVRDSMGEMLATFSSRTPPLWSESGSLIFCEEELAGSAGWALMSWDGQRVNQLTQYGSFSVTLPNGQGLSCKPGD